MLSSSEKLLEFFPFQNFEKTIHIKKLDIGARIICIGSSQGHAMHSFLHA